LPPPRGLGGRAPKTKTRGSAANFCQPASEWDSKLWRTISKRGWAKTGGGGGRAPSQGAVGDVPPKQKQGVSYQLLPTCHRMGLKALANPSKRGWAKIGGGGGRAPSQGAVGDVPPKTKIRGKLPTFTNLPPSGTQGPGKPSANGGGQKLGGTRGRWGCPPTKLKLGVSSQPL